MAAGGNKCGFCLLPSFQRSSPLYSGLQSGLSQLALLLLKCLEQHPSLASLLTFEQPQILFFSRWQQ